MSAAVKHNASRIYSGTHACRRSLKGGFTVIELVVALVIFAGMSVALTASYINILDAYQIVQSRPQRDLDLRFARNALLAEPDFETAQKGDQFDGASGRHVTWSAVIEPTTTADLFTVTFTCELGPGSDPKDMEQTVTEVFRVLRPTWSQTAPQSAGTDRNTLRTEARDRILQDQQPSPLSGISGSSSGSSKGNTGATGGGTRGSGSGGNTNTKNTKGGGGARSR